MLRVQRARAREEVERAERELEAMLRRHESEIRQEKEEEEEYQHECERLWRKTVAAPVLRGTKTELEIRREWMEAEEAEEERQYQEQKRQRRKRRAAFEREAELMYLQDQISVAAAVLKVYDEEVGAEEGHKDINPDLGDKPSNSAPASVDISAPALDVSGVSVTQDNFVLKDTVKDNSCDNDTYYCESNNVGRVIDKSVLGDGLRATTRRPCDATTATTTPGENEVSADINTSNTVPNSPPLLNNATDQAKPLNASNHLSDTIFHNEIFPSLESASPRTLDPGRKQQRGIKIGRSRVYRKVTRADSSRLRNTTRCALYPQLACGGGGRPPPQKEKGKMAHGPARSNLLTSPVDCPTLIFPHLCIQPNILSGFKGGGGYSFSLRGISTGECSDSEGTIT